MNEPVTWTIPQLTDWVNAVITETLGGEIWVEGEITNLQRSAKGHVYFTLIEPGADAGSASHTLSVTLFDWHRKNVNNHLRRSGGAVRMDNGVRVRIRGAVEIYAVRSQLQLKMSGIDPAFTLGTMAADRDLLMRALAAEGLLDANRRCPIPAIPERIVLVTSLGSAAYADFCHEIERGGIGLGLLTVDARVQGAEATVSLCHALALAIDRQPDLIALVRGGGAATDLAAFDQEIVVRTVARSPVAVWCGIGHETDRTVTDDVVHTSFKTPTACATAVVEHAQHGIDELEERWSQVCDAAADRLDATERRIQRAGTRTAGRSRDRFERASNRLDHATRTLTSAIPRRLNDTGRRLDTLAATVRAYDPANVLARGYSITRGTDGRIVQAESLAAGDELVTVLADGTVRSTVHGVDGSGQ